MHSERAPEFRYRSENVKNGKRHQSLFFRFFTQKITNRTSKCSKFFKHIHVRSKFTLHTYISGSVYNIITCSSPLTPPPTHPPHPPAHLLPAVASKVVHTHALTIPVASLPFPSGVIHFFVDFIKMSGITPIGDVL